MATIPGTSGDDILIGTSADDLLIAAGGTDLLKGRGGADIYELYFAKIASGPGPYYTINETSGGDASVDIITGVGSLVQPADFAVFSRGGANGRNLIIETAFKQHNFWSDGIESGTIKIVNQYNPTTPMAQIETIVAGGVTYNLLNADTGTASADIITGWKLADTLSGGDGGDYISGGRGNDFLYGEDGADYVFGQNGRDKLYGGLDNDRMFGGNGNDKLWGEDGDDQLSGDVGADRLFGGNDNDILQGGIGNDRLSGGRGIDVLHGDAGNDTLIGGKGGDLYMVASTEGGTDTIIDKGNAPTIYTYSYSGMDEIRFTGFVDAAEGIRSLGIAMIGDDLVFTYENAAQSPGVVGQVIVQDHFLGASFALEEVSFGTGIGHPVYHIANLSGDDFTYSVHSGPDQGGEDIVLGTSGDDQIYGGIGGDVMLGGTGADRFMFHDEEDNGYGADMILDFDLTEDILDFTELKTLTRAGVSIVDNGYGNAVVSSSFFSIELIGVAAVDVADAVMDFF